MWLTPIAGRAVPLLYLKTIQISILPPKRKECICEENSALDDTDGTFGQTGITERRFAHQFVEVVDVERARSNEKSASNEREEEILRDKKKSHLMEIIVLLLWTLDVSFLWN